MGIRRLENWRIWRRDKLKINKDPIAIVQGNHKRPTFLWGIVTLKDIEWALSLMRMQFPLNCVMESFAVKGMEVGVGRNYVAETALKQEPRPEYVLMIGDDNLPSWNSLVILYEEIKKGGYDILSGLYYIKTDQYAPPEPVMWRDGIAGFLQAGIHFIPGEVIFVDGCGMDFTLIKTDVFDRLGPPPWFKTSDSTDMLNDKGIGAFTEDVYFCNKVRVAGLKIGVHTGCRVAHLNYKMGEVY